MIQLIADDSHMRRGCLRMKLKKKEGEPKDGEGQTHKDIVGAARSSQA